jgi:hypothetical protein
VPPRCEDGSTAARSAEGSLSCADGSEPTCQENAGAKFASDGTILYCIPPPNAGPSEACTPGSAGCGSFDMTESSTSACDDGSPARLQNATYTCADGSEPACAEGAPPTLSNDGTTLVCESLSTRES